MRFWVAGLRSIESGVVGCYYGVCLVTSAAGNRNVYLVGYVALVFRVRIHSTVVTRSVFYSVGTVRSSRW